MKYISGVPAPEILSVKTFLALMIVVITLGVPHVNLHGVIQHSSMLNNFIHLIVLSIACVTLLTLVFINKISVSLTCIDIAFTVFILYLIGNGYYVNKNINNASVNLSIVLVYYFLLKFYLGDINKQLMSSVVFYIAFAVAGIQLVYCFLQLSGIITNPNPNYALGGSFGHPGYTAGLLMIVSVLGVTSFTVNTRTPSVALKIILVVMVIVLLVMLKSRASLLAVAIIGILVIAKFALKGFLKNVVIFVLLLVMGLSLAYGLFKLKPDSSYGRLYIWKRCVSLIGSEPYGGGYGNFQFYYNNFQRQYFATVNASPHEKYTADYVEMAYNDFLEIGVETGVVGVLLMLLLLSVVFSTALKSARAGDYDLAPVYALVAFLVISLTWSLLKDINYLYVFTYLLIVSSNNSNREYKIV
jgi:O-antigen ligase